MAIFGFQVSGGAKYDYKHGLHVQFGTDRKYIYIMVTYMYCVCMTRKDRLTVLCTLIKSIVFHH